MAEVIILMIAKLLSYSRCGYCSLKELSFVIIYQCHHFDVAGVHAVKWLRDISWCVHLHLKLGTESLKTDVSTVKSLLYFLFQVYTHNLITIILCLRVTYQPCSHKDTMLEWCDNTCLVLCSTMTILVCLQCSIDI